MIKIKLIVPKLLSNNQSMKGNTHVFDLEYEKPVTETGDGSLFHVS